MTGYDFYGEIDDLVDGLDLPQNCFESSCEVCDLIQGVDGFSNRFRVFGGFDAVVVLSVFLGARRRGCPVPADVLVDFVRSGSDLSVSTGFDGSKLDELSKKFKKILSEEDGFEPVFVTAEDYVSFYSDRLSFPVRQEDLEDELDVSQVAVRYTYKEIVEGLTGVDTSYLALDDVAVTAESFGFYGDGVEEFGLHLLEEVEGEGLGVRSKSPRVLAASVLYVGGKLI